MIAPALLAALLQRCAPNTDVRTLAAIVEVESGGDSWAIRDPIANRAIHPRSYTEAVAIANALLSKGVQVSVGLSQVLLPRPGLDAATLLGSPCADLRAGSSILASAYAGQIQLVAAPWSEIGQQLALRRALSVYNSGSATGAPEYTARLLAALSSPLVESVTGIADEDAVATHQAGIATHPVVIVRSVVPDTIRVTPAPYVSSLFYRSEASR